MTNLATIFRREFAAVTTNPVALSVVLAFVVLSAALTFHVGGFFERGQADLRPFFRFHPWLHLFFMPALGMRLWAEERRNGTLELLLTLPVPVVALVGGKFLAMWAVAGLTLVLTLAAPLSVGFLGTPDVGPMVTGYIGSWFLAGGFLAVTACISALTRSQVVAFVAAAAVCFLLLFTGSRLAGNLGAALGVELGQTATSLSALTHFDSLVEGHVTLHAAIFFGSLIAFAIYLNVALVKGMDGR